MTDLDWLQSDGIYIERAAVFFKGSAAGQFKKWFSDSKEVSFNVVPRIEYIISTTATLLPWELF